MTLRTRIPIGLASVMVLLGLGAGAARVAFAEAAEFEVGEAPPWDRPAELLGAAIEGEPPNAPSSGAEPPGIGSPLALPLLAAEERPRGRLARRGGLEGRRPRSPVFLSGARARILLQSLTVPGWGQATLGRNTAATVFGLLDAGVWGSFTAFRIQQQMRRQTYERTARIFAGIDLHGRDEEFRRLVGSYPSSEEYNRFVVFRDAANLYYEDPVKYRAYIAEHELKGADAWSWESPESYSRYREERKRTQKAGLRANAALGFAIANRLVSAIHAARYAGRSQISQRSWNLECVPAGSDPTAFRLGVRARF